MKITKERLNEYIVQFIKGHLIPNATKLETKFRLGFALGADLLSEFREELAVVADADGNIDLDLLKRGIQAGMEAAGEMRIEKLKITLEKQDVDKFIRLVETGALS